MKVFCVYFGMMIVMLGIWVEVGTAQEDPSTWMPDANLRAIVQANLTYYSNLGILASSALTKDNLKEFGVSLGTLNIPNQGIVDLTGLEYAFDKEIRRGISVLNLNGNKISDLSPLKNLRLINLFLANNRITKTDDLLGLETLDTLAIDGNRITDVKEFQKLAQLPNLGAFYTNSPDGLVDGRANVLALLRNPVALRALLYAPPFVGSDPMGNRGLVLKRIDARSVTLSWEIPANINAGAIIEYQYSIDGGQTWISTYSTDTSVTITEDGLGNLSSNQFQIRAVALNAAGTGRVVLFVLSARTRRIIQDCPVGWVRSDGFAGRTRRVLIYEVNVEMDLHNRVSIYKPIWVAIYVHPDEKLENLEGWKLQVALPYNHHREYLLTAENSVVVDAKIEGVAGGFAFIANPEEDPFPMTGIGFTGSPAPGFDYRLYDETGRKIDFGISCYKRFDIFQVLKDTEDPRVLRKVLLESFDWDAHYLRSEWTVPVPVNVQGAPSLQRVNLVGKWADLKKQ